MTVLPRIQIINHARIQTPDCLLKFQSIYADYLYTSCEASITCTLLNVVTRNEINFQCLNFDSIENKKL